MENEEFLNALLANMKKELKDFAQIQKNLKKSRKLKFRPKVKSLQSICDEIDNNAYLITELLFYYVWLNHSKKYWINRNIDSYWKYNSSDYNSLCYYSESLENDPAWWINSEKGGVYATYGEYVKRLFAKFIENKAHDYNLSFDGSFNEFIEK